MTDAEQMQAQLDFARRNANRALRRAIDHRRYTRPQRLFMAWGGPIALWRDGNQVGKTVGILDDMVHRCRGTHPFQRTRRPPINVLCLSESWDQMGQAGGFMSKVWDSLPKDEIDPKVRFEPGRGITGKPPRIVFTSGPGKGSVISFSTFRAGASRVQGATVHHVVTDEPPPGSVYQELLPRLLRHGGTLRMDFTPRIDMPDQTELRKLVIDKEVEEFNFSLRAENCWPEGAPCPWLPQSRIDALSRGLPEAIRKMRIEGAWDQVITDQYLTNFAKERHVKHWTPPPAGAYLALGVDHSTSPGRQAAMLTAFTHRTSLDPRIWWWDEAIQPGFTNSRQDAIAIKKMLEDNYLTPSMVDLWIGDREVSNTPEAKRKNNEKLRRELAALYGVHVDNFPEFVTPSKRGSSVEDGLWQINDVMGSYDKDGTPHAMVNPKCEHFIKFCERFRGDPRDPLKDVGDAGRYPCEVAIESEPFERSLQVYS